MEARDFIAALVDKGWTQSQIAERTGIPQPTLSKVLRGDVADVMSRNYRKLQSLHREVFPPRRAHRRTEGQGEPVKAGV